MDSDPKLTMQAVVIERFGGPDALAMHAMPVPQPGPGEVRVRLAVAGVNYIDVYMRNGTYARSDTYQTPLPMVPGMEGAGVVDAVGEGVDGLAPGDARRILHQPRRLRPVRRRAGVEAGARAGRAPASKSPAR